MSRIGWIIASAVLVAALGGWWYWSTRSSERPIVCNAKSAVGCVTPPANTSANTADRTVTNADAGSTITVGTGKTLAVRLETLIGAGYQWSLDSYDQSLLRLDSDQLLEPALTGDQEITGAPQEQEWMFTALKTGTTEVKLTNFRPFEPKPTTPTFTVTVTVE